jgi:deoxyribose-phosphate aldolase
VIPQTARRVIGLLDLTSLGDDDTEQMIADLCARAVTPFGPVAAVCVWPRFVAQARRLLGDTPVKVATVINFPHGDGDPAGVAAATRAAAADGAQEIDVVAPWRPFLEGDEAYAGPVLQACREACGADAGLKVIVESGAFADAADGSAALRRLCDTALAAGADFLKTSTGKREPGASLAAAAVFYDAITAANSPAGVKISGGVRTCEQAAAYLAQAAARKGEGWAAPATFRFGASALLDALLPAAADEIG